MKFATLNHSNIANHWQAGIPTEWNDTGIPSLIYIDADNEEHWQKYANEFIVRDRVNSWDTCREELIDAAPLKTQFGYNLGYYPIDVETWEMVPEGPFCAECTKPEFSNEHEIEGLTAWHVELMDGSGDDVVTYCAGCGEILWEDEY